jgi:hypothetical protein
VRFRFPVINWGLAFLVPTAFCCCTGLLAANLPMNAGFPLWSNGCMYTQATWKEAQYRQLAAKPNAKALIQSYSATGLRGPTNGVYSTSFFSCCNDPITLLYVLLCVEPSYRRLLRRSVLAVWLLFLVRKSSSLERGARSSLLPKRVAPSLVLDPCQLASATHTTAVRSSELCAA